MKSLIVLGILGACAMWAQNQPAPDPSGLNARELFYTAPPAATPAAPKTASKKKMEPKRTAPPAQQVAPQVADQAAPKAHPSAAPAPAANLVTVAATTAAVPLGLRYSVLKRDPQNQFTEVDPDTTFHSGDRIRIEVKANTSGYLYVIAQGSSGNWQVLFPSPEVAGGSNRLMSGDTRQVPPGDRGQFVFDDQGGTEKLFLVLSRQAEPDLDKLIYSVKGTGGPDASHTMMASASVGNEVVERLRQQVAARDLVFEKVDGEVDGKVENAAYVVNPNPGPDARLVVDVALKHK